MSVIWTHEHSTAKALVKAITGEMCRNWTVNTAFGWYSMPGHQAWSNVLSLEVKGMEWELHGSGVVIRSKEVCS